MFMGNERTSSLAGEGARLGILLVGKGDVTDMEVGSETSVDGVSLCGDVSCGVREGDGWGRVKGVNDRR